MFSAQKRKLKSLYRRAKRQFVLRFRSYDANQLKKRLQGMGIRPGDTLLVHSAYRSDCGFQGNPGGLVETFMDVVGNTGNLLMVSMPYSTSTSEYLRKGCTFDVRSTPSKMGLVTEAFRRRPDVLRSNNPAHPILVCGPKAEWIIAGHERCVYSCGPGSPFDKLAALNGKVLMFGVSEMNFTFYHHLEHLLKDRLPFALYEPEPFAANMIDAQGESRTVTAYAFSKETISRRRPQILHEELQRRRFVTNASIGNTKLGLVSVRDSINCTIDLADRGILFYALGDPPARAIIEARQEAS